MKLLNVSLRAKLIGLVMAVVMLLGAGTIVNLNQFENYYKNRINTQLVFTAIKLGKAITAQLFERYGDAQAFAMNRSITSLNKEIISDDLDNYIKLYGIYDLILVIDKHGKLVAANSMDPKGNKSDQQKLAAIDYSKFAWFENALKEKFTEDKDNQYTGTYVDGFLLNTVIGEAYGEAKFGSIFSAPIKDAKGEIIGVLANHAGSRWFENEISDFHKQMIEEEFAESEIFVFNHEGKVVSHSDAVPGTKNASLENDQKIILNYDLDKYHNGLHSIVKRGNNGFQEMMHEEKNLLDLVAYHNLNNSKSIASLGWTLIVEDNAEDAYHLIQQTKVQSYAILISIVFFGLLLAIWAGIIISKSIAKVTTTLAVNSEEVADASNKIATSSTELSETATQQAAALQETVAAVDEISAMVQRNAESAQKSKEVSHHSREAATKGREIVTAMIQAIQEIDHSNDAVSNQMTESNRQLFEITKLINNISSKTNVINEIVFQTKLLSFNASVEAARAGEAGKGFAVVAEEVGNLAQMSGTAAKEISSLLDESVQKVNSIVNETKNQVERLMLTSKEKVKQGSRTAQDCNNSLEEIMNQVQTVDSLVSEIAVASQEQSTGIREVSRAMGQMEQATQQNSSVANATSVAGEQIRSQSEVLNTLVKDLSFIVSGQDQMAPTSQQGQPLVRTIKKESFKNSSVKEKPSVLGKILKFTKNKKVKSPDGLVEKVNGQKIKPVKLNATIAKPLVEKVVAENKVAMASGADFVPSGNDPGFNE